MLFLKVLLLSLQLFATEPEYDEPPTEPEIIHVEIEWRQKIRVGEIILDEEPAPKYYSDPFKLPPLFEDEEE